MSLDSLCYFIIVNWLIQASGFLSKPATQYPSIFGRFKILHKFPYLLPCIFASILMLIGAILVAIFMKPVRKNHKTLLDDEEIKEPEEPRLRDVELEDTDAIDNREQESEVIVDPATLKQKSIIKQSWNSFRDELKEVYSLLLSKDILIPLLMYFLSMIIEVVQDELLPLWCMVEIQNGGLSFNTSQIGIVQTILGVVYLICPVAYPISTKYFGQLNSGRIGFILTLPLLFTPQISLAANSKALLWISLTVYSIVRGITGTFNFTAAIIMVNNGAPEGKEGKVMAFSNSIGVLAKFISPLIAGPLFAVSTKFATKIGLIGLNTPFAFFCFLAVLSIAASLLLNNSVNKPMREREQEKQ
jgi:hypothetical protein